MNNFDQQELDKFSKLADEWWNPNGKFKPLHLINPLRVSYIEDKVELRGLDILDIGCGGGILSEALSKKGANVTAIDLADGPLEVAKIRQKESKLDIRYEKKSTSELVDEGNKFDVITCLEMLEHVPDPAEIVKDCADLTKNEVIFSV
jgi:ubiquinone biosynthesis O-methyltransferase